MPQTNGSIRSDTVAPDRTEDLNNPCSCPGAWERQTRCVCRRSLFTHMLSQLQVQSNPDVTSARRSHIVPETIGRGGLTTGASLVLIAPAGACVRASKGDVSASKTSAISTLDAVESLEVSTILRHLLYKGLGNLSCRTDRVR